MVRVGELFLTVFDERPVLFTAPEERLLSVKTFLFPVVALVVTLFILLLLVFLTPELELFRRDETEVAD